MGPDVEEREDVGVVERGRGPRLLLKPSQALRVRANSAGRTLTATSRPSRVSRALYTSPMPPAPIGERIS